MGLGSRKVGPEAQRRHAEDQQSAERLPELVEAVGAARRELRAAQDADAGAEELNRLGVRLDAALTDAMRAAYARQRALVGPRGLDDRIYRRKRLARPEIKQATAVAEQLLTMRERHRLHGIVRVPRSPAAV
ncbi:hypothetical protein HDA32_003407 [Spinactinospora alkalitolerans]|uniref:Uncharacterized protein n=1 Tax=Spinactinospora alkalitolerans TaxID=687207 RepID=A0A852TYC9_9ACTN|nr:hypothetical protein [Spinactinospora alkalitolerans]NYE48287.1 hypothetical protein [Spinactinospora alkalitolerans]